MSAHKPISVVSYSAEVFEPAVAQPLTDYILQILATAIVMEMLFSDNDSSSSPLFL